jgi:hypothetical protein
MFLGDLKDFRKPLVTRAVTDNCASEKETRRQGNCGGLEHVSKKKGRWSPVTTQREDHKMATTYSWSQLITLRGPQNGVYLHLVTSDNTMREDHKMAATYRR